MKFQHISKLSALVFFCLIIGNLLMGCESSSRNTAEGSIEEQDSLFVPPSIDTLQKKDSVPVRDSVPLTIDPLPKVADSLPSDAPFSLQDVDSVWSSRKADTVSNGGLLPHNRILAFYGNLYSKRMGILGEYPKDTVLKKLQQKADKWFKADTSKPIVKALELIVVTGQDNPAGDSLYRQRMPFWMIDTVLQMAERSNSIVILDIQIGRSTVEKEIPYFEKYLKLPQVHLAVDPEFAVKKDQVPGRVIGSMDAQAINFCSEYLEHLVDSLHLPPKLLIVHRFTQPMVTNYQHIKLRPAVQIIMNMDGFGSQAIKRESYRRYIYKEPVQYTGIKLFLKNDNKGTNRIMTPQDVLGLYPIPLYIQYQ